MLVPGLCIATMISGEGTWSIDASLFKRSI
jgi:hypothetical protein